MKRAMAFARRNARELVRDPLTVGFSLGFPLVLLALLTIIQRNIPVSMFEIDRLAPGVAAFGLTFAALFSATLIARDRASSLMLRLCASPMRPGDFIAGYLAPMLPLCAAQIAVCYAAALAAGLKLGGNAILSMLTLLPAAALYVAIGLLCGTLLNDRQVGGVCGALLTNVCAWLSGIWFDLSLLGDGFRRVAETLPFANSVTAARAALAGEPAGIGGPLLNVCLWAAGVLALAVWMFHRRMKRGV